MMGNPYVVSQEFNWKYIGKAYLLSIMFIAVILVINLMNGFIYDLMAYAIASGIAFPFARYLYDSIIGFWIQKKEIEAIYKNSSAFLYHRMDNLGIAFTYFLSLFLAPIGILFLLLRALYRFATKTGKE